MIHVYDSRTLAVSPWRNGGGETREVVSIPPGKTDFDWRISIATIAADGDFSRFDQVDRIITLLSGEVTLYRDQQPYHPLVLNQPFAFRGEEAISARLAGDASTDFNIMTHRARYRAEAGVTEAAFSSSDGVSGVVFILAGEWQHDRRVLTPGQGAWWENQGGTFVPLSAGATLLWGIFTAKSVSRSGTQ